MKRFLVACAFLLIPGIVLGYTSPGKPAGYVNDFAGMLSPALISNLSQRLNAFTEETGAEVAIVTVPTIGADETIETYAVKLFEEWGIGDEKEDKGILLLIARDDREMRIEVGYGLEHVMTDIQSAAIIREILTPAFQQTRFDEGVAQAIEIVVESVRKGEFQSSGIAPAKFPFSANMLPFLLFLVMFVVSILARSKSWWLGGVIGLVLALIFFGSLLWAIGLTLIGLVFDYIVSKTYKKSKDSGIDPPWWIGGGHHGGGGIGGGFGGFGGGMSGGGGASGRW